MNELLPCPFCGSLNSKGIFTEDSYVFVKCLDCHACGPAFSVFEMAPDFSASQLAKEKWNKRYETHT